MRSCELTVRNAVLEDIDVVNASVREEDEKEIIASGFKTTREALVYSYENSSIAFTLEGPDGVPLAIFGVVPHGTLLGEVATVWMIGCRGLSAYRRSFARLSKPMIGNLLGCYPVLVNIVDARYYKTIRWLRWCGAEFGEPYAVGINGELFRRFEMRRA